VIEPTHAFTINGRTRMDVTDSQLQSPAEIIRDRLSRLNGKELYSLGIWSLPRGVPLDQVSWQTWPQEYMQVAGSREHMTLEIRRFGDGDACQYVVGRPPVGVEAEVVIPWDAHEARVFANEVLDAAEAAELFTAYYHTHDVPETCHLRLLVL